MLLQHQARRKPSLMIMKMDRTIYSRRKNRINLLPHQLLKNLQLILSLKRICYLMMEILMMISLKRNLYLKFQNQNQLNLKFNKNLQNRQLLSLLLKNKKKLSLLHLLHLQNHPSLKYNLRRKLFNKNQLYNRKQWR